MLQTTTARVLFLSSIGITAVPATTLADPIPVELRQTDEGWVLLRGGEPYFIRGAGGDGPLDQLAAAGANSLRTWGADDLDELLDRAHALGLSVTVGIWLGHERHGFDYDDPNQVREQFERAKRAVLRYKDHPAVLLWGIGNEMEGFKEGDNPAIWTAVNDIAEMVKSIDPLHPTMTVTAEIGGERLDAVQKRCPAIDIHGINSYGGSLSLPERYREGGATKPYVVTETGPPGTWEVPPNEWGAPQEPTSTDKAEFYRASYEHAVSGAPGLSLGSYVFLWGWKMEATPTWSGMFLPDGAPLGAIDVMTTLWSGNAPENLAPTIQPLVVRGSAQVEPGATVEVAAQVADREGSPVRVRWELRRDPNEHSTGGDYQPTPPLIEGAILEGKPNGAKVRMPETPGQYRVFAYAYDDTGRAATANTPLLVSGKPRATLPFYVYRNGFDGMPWTPSGWMGETESLSVRGDYEKNPHEGDACIEIRFVGAPGTWVGVAWQDPPNDWGDRPGGYDLSGAKYLEVWARGKYGGEKVSMGVGLLGADKAHPDSDKASLEDVRLTYEWTRYRIRLRKRDLSRIKTGFFFTMGGKGNPVTVYFDSIRFVKK